MSFDAPGEYIMKVDFSFKVWNICTYMNLKDYPIYAFKIENFEIINYKIGEGKKYVDFPVI